MAIKGAEAVVDLFSDATDDSDKFVWLNDLESIQDVSSVSHVDTLPVETVSRDDTDGLEEVRECRLSLDALDMVPDDFSWQCDHQDLLEELSTVPVEDVECQSESGNGSVGPGETSWSARFRAALPSRENSPAVDGNGKEEEKVLVTNDTANLESEECVICASPLELADSLGILPDCRHAYCFGCIKRWASEATKCPLCKTPFEAIRQVGVGSKLARAVDTLVLVTPKTFHVDDGLMSRGCQICGVDNNWSELLLCDSCDHGYHLRCLAVPLEAVPEGNWFCPTCASLDRRLQSAEQLRRRRRPRRAVRRPREGAAEPRRRRRVGTSPQPPTNPVETTQKGSQRGLLTWLEECVLDVEAFVGGLARNDDSHTIWP